MSDTRVSSDTIIVPDTPPPRRSFALVLIATSLPMFMAMLDNLVMTNALPVLYVELGATVAELPWFVNAYTLAFAGCILLASALGDRFGRRTMFAIGIAVFGIGSVLAALSSDPGQLIAARAIQGLGAAGVMPLSLVLLAGAVRPERRPVAIGVWGGVSGLGVAVGPLVGGAVIEGWDWQSIFWINIPVVLIALPLALWGLPNAFGRRERVDLLGVMLVGFGVTALVHAIVRGNEDGWSRPDVVAELVGGALLILWFVAWQSRAGAPMIPLRLFRDRSFSLVNVVGLAFSFGAFGSIFLLIQFLQVVQGASPLDAALQTSPWTLAPMVVAPLAGLIAPRVGTRVLIVAGLTLLGSALLWLTLLLDPDVAYPALVPSFVMAGVGMGLVFAPSATALLATLGDADHAKASGVNATTREIGVALGIAVLAAIFLGAGGQFTPTGYVDAARPAILTGAMVLLACAVAALFLPRGATPAGEVDQVEPAPIAAVHAPGTGA